MKVDPELEDFRGTGSEIRLLVVALDYKYSPGNELTCTHDAAKMVWLAERSGVQDITVVTDAFPGQSNFPTRQKLITSIQEVGRRCRPRDWFVFFFAGHGINVPDTTGDEADGFDEAFVTPDAGGHLKPTAVLVDDDFAQVLDNHIPREVRVMCICDCCHSGTICDIDSYEYHHEIYQISAAQDSQEAVDTGWGGVLTAALTKTIWQLTLLYGSKPYSIAQVFEGCLKRAARMTQLQELSLQFSGGDPAKAAWPLTLPRAALLRLGSRGIHEYEHLANSDDSDSDS